MVRVLIQPARGYEGFDKRGGVAGPLAGASYDPIWPFTNVSLRRNVGRGVEQISDVGIGVGVGDAEAGSQVERLGVPESFPLHLALAPSPCQPTPVTVGAGEILNPSAASRRPRSRRT